MLLCNFLTCLRPLDIMLERKARVALGEKEESISVASSLFSSLLKQSTSCLIVDHEGVG